jgi:phosphoribosylanthranilate isomerase
MTRVKICGLTRPEDAACAATAGAHYTGVVFAASPRQVDAARAIEVLAPARGRSEVVGVFGRATPAEIARVAAAVSLDVVQLHADPTPADVREVRERFPGAVWAACRVRASVLPAEVAELAAVADAVVLDAHSAAGLGGTGVSLDWGRLASGIGDLRHGRAAFVLAGGLRSSSVGEAVRLLSPDIVDVSSGVEHAPGIKAHEEIRAFTAAVHAAAPAAAPRR